MTTQPDFFPQLSRRLDRAEIEQGFAELLRAVAAMEFAADASRGLRERVEKEEEPCE